MTIKRFDVNFTRRAKMKTKWWLYDVDLTIIVVIENCSKIVEKAIKKIKAFLKYKKN